MTRLLFICTQNSLRSPTAQEVFCSPTVETLSAGTNTSCGNPLTPSMLLWADVVVFMEQGHLDTVRNRAALEKALQGKQWVVLNIPDRYDRNQPELVELLKSLMPRFL